MKNFKTMAILLIIFGFVLDALIIIFGFTFFMKHLGVSIAIGIFIGIIAIWVAFKYIKKSKSKKNEQ